MSTATETVPTKHVQLVQERAAHEARIRKIDEEIVTVAGADARPTSAPISAPISGVVERVPAHDLNVGDTIIVTALNGEYVGVISEIVEQIMVYQSMLDRDRARFGVVANGACLIIRLPHLNAIRGRHDMVRRVVRP